MGINKEQSITQIARYELDLLKQEMASKGKEVIKTSTLKNRILAHNEIRATDTNTVYLASIGLTQVVQSVLWADGWRSVLGNGYFASPSICKHSTWLMEMLKSAESRAQRFEAACEGVRQYAMVFDGTEPEGLAEEPNIEDIVADLEAHAI